jgi:L-arabinokinase
MSGGFGGLDGVTRDIPFIARRSTRVPAEVRRALSIPVEQPFVLLSFGAYGVPELDSASLEGMRDYTIGSTERAGRFFYLSETELATRGYDYLDLVRAADAVITKPGYGIISDAIANDTALLYTSRGRFAEYEVLVREMPRYARVQFIAQEDLRAGRWRTAVETLLASPRPVVPDLTGAAVAADAILRLSALASSRR